MKMSYVMLLVLCVLACVCIQAETEDVEDKTSNKGRIRPYSKNPHYCQYEGQPLLLRNLQSQGLTIANKGTDNPTILYNGKPMLRAGSVSEQALFAFPWDSSHSVLKNETQTHEQWAQWQRKSGMGFARAYPESGYTWMEKGPESEKIYPWNVVCRKDGHPVVDLTQFDPTYWKEFAKTIRKCKEKDIVLLIQLYQACYFLGYFPGGYGAAPSENELTWWQASYFHPDNNVNKWPIGTTWPPTGQPCGMDFPQRVVDDYPDGPWWILHKTYVQKILDAVGDQGHVIIDLGNEVGYRREGLHCYEWVERTLDIIEQWEKQHAVDILVGMDEHFWFRVPSKRDWVRKHRRLEVLIVHGFKDVVHEEGYDFKRGNTPRHPGKLRVECRKPCVSIHNQSERVKAADRHAGFQRLYQWLAMMQKVQGIGSYGYGKFIDDPTERKTWESQTRFLMDFFNRLHNYADLALSDATIASAPEQCHYRCMLQSAKEAVVYLHTQDFGMTVPAGKVLTLRNLDLPDGQVKLWILKPKDSTRAKSAEMIRGSSLEVRLPEFCEDICVYVEKK